MSDVPASYQALAEAVSPLVHSLSAGLLRRPVPMTEAEAAETCDGETLATLCLALEDLLEAAVPEIQALLVDLGNCEEDELEELVDEIAEPALDIVDMARRLWSACLPDACEGVRPLLATIAEAPVVALLEWCLQIMHTSIDPWAMTETPDDPPIEYVLEIVDAPVRAALSRWRQEHSGMLPDDALV